VLKREKYHHSERKDSYLGVKQVLKQKNIICLRDEINSDLQAKL